MIGLYRVCGSRNEASLLNMPKQGQEVEDYTEEEDSNDMGPSCKERLTPYIINPESRYKVAWDMALGLLYLVLFWMDIYIIAFRFLPLEMPSINSFQRVSNMILVLSMLLIPVTGVPKKETILPIDAEDKKLKMNRMKRSQNKRILQSS